MVTLYPPLLFALVPKNLSQNIHIAKANNQNDSYVMGGACSLSHLIFADDILQFSRAPMKPMKTFQSIIDNFAIFSSIKSTIIKVQPFFSKYTHNKQKLLTTLCFAEGVCRSGILVCSSLGGTSTPIHWLCRSDQPTTRVHGKVEK